MTGKGVVEVEVVAVESIVGWWLSVNVIPVDVNGTLTPRTFA
jgi:hypothetical protein